MQEAAEDGEFSLIHHGHSLFHHQKHLHEAPTRIGAIQAVHSFTDNIRHDVQQPTPTGSGTTAFLPPL